MKYNKILFILYFSMFFNALVAKSHSYDGPYVGIMLGHEYGDAKFFSRSSQESPNEQSNNFLFKGFKEEFVAGWGKLFEKCYLGIEAFGSLSQAQGNAFFSHDTIMIDGKNTFRSTIDKKHSYGLTLQAGYQFYDKTLLYLKAGKIDTKFNLKIANANSGDPNENFSRTFHKNIAGFLLGTGAEIKVSEGFLARLEFCHINYDRKTLPPNNSGSFVNAYFRPQSNEFKLGMIVPIA